MSTTSLLSHTRTHISAYTDRLCILNKLTHTTLINKIKIDCERKQGREQKREERAKEGREQKRGERRGSKKKNIDRKKRKGKFESHLVEQCS